MKKSDGNIRNVAIIFGKHEDGVFNRYTFPILGRPVAAYPILAALGADRVDATYLSSDSPSLLNVGENMQGTRILKRSQSQPTLTEEVRVALERVSKEIGYVPSTVTVLLANSPCSSSEIIDEALDFLESQPDYDSVVTAMKRKEFSPARIFLLNSDNKLDRTTATGSPDDVYFLDRRVMVLRSHVVLDSRDGSDYFENLLGKSVHPIIQEDGIWDIDYIWQVPVVERWLRQSGFTESDTPYDKKRNRTPSGFSFTSVDHKKKGKSEKSYKALITTVPFGAVDPTPIMLLESTPNIEYVINPIGRKLKENELPELVKEFDIIIAGTEPITRKVMENGPNLKLIARVGIGLDSVDLVAARELGIAVTYTPDAPSPAVAELTIAHMINMLRRVPLVDRKLRFGIWQRIHGERLANMTTGIIGTGRVGSRVLRHLQGFGPRRIMVNDLKPDYNLYEMYHAEFAEKEAIYREADIITLHVPLTPLTRNLISKQQMDIMKKGVFLINTSRGGIVNEHDLYVALSGDHIAGAAIDTFESEPYTGNLIELDNCYLSCHMGSMTNDCRAAMEIQATEEVCRFVRGEPLKQVVPDEEYQFVQVK